MAVFDPTLDAAPVAEQNTDPILPEDRFIFELVGFERSAPDQYHKNGGIKWTFRVWNMDGTPFYFNNEHYDLWRTTNINAAGKPLFNIGTQAHDWASALLGRQLGIDEHFNVSEMAHKRFSAMVVWMPKKTKPGEKAATLASLRHIPVGAPSNGHATQVSADPSDDEIERASILTDLNKAVKMLTKFDSERGKEAADAVAASPKNADLGDLKRLRDDIQIALDKAMDE